MPGEGCVFTIDVPLAAEVVSVSGTNLAYFPVKK
jgi:hypothetical protein